MKKIGILTQYLHSKNIGGLLQAYALPRFLNSLGYKVEQVTFDFNHIPACNKWQQFRLLWAKFTLNKLKNKLTHLSEKKIFPPVQNSLLEIFEQEIPHSTHIYTSNELINANQNYNAFVIGSDQVWCDAFFPLSAFWGEFAAPNKKVISYAASSSVKQFIPYAEKIFIKKLQRLDAISVREKTLKDYIERITDKKADVVLDPTFLLSKQEWLKIANPAVVPNQKYIFCYFLGGKSAWQRKAARAYADKYGYELVHLPYIMQNIRMADIYLKGQGRYDVGPREFISLINGAECVFTDSFHGMAFSINFNKDFYVFNRDDKDGINSMTSRITDTLAMFGLTDRHITDKNAVLESKTIDYTDTNKILNQKKEFSVNWLLNALKD